MRIAAITKNNLTGHPSRVRLLEGLRSGGKFAVTEIPAGGSVPSDCERVLVFGGDGTMLDAAVRCARLNIPVMGINLGKLGFLSQFEADASCEDVTAALLGGEVEYRMLLECKSGKGNFLALNDIVLKSADARPVTVGLYVDGRFVDSYRSDGVITATPTGSTAYSLSAGGPILAPNLSAVVVNPVCPHSLHSRPLVVSAESSVCLELASAECANLVVDGQITARLSEQAVIIISRSSLSAPFVKTNGRGFYEKLLDKMNRWGVTP